MYTITMEHRAMGYGHDVNIGPANVGMAHSNQRYFLEHSEEPYSKLTPDKHVKPFIKMYIFIDNMTFILNKSG